MMIASRAAAEGGLTYCVQTISRPLMPTTTGLIVESRLRNWFWIDKPLQTIQGHVGSVRHTPTYATHGERLIHSSLRGLDGVLDKIVYLLRTVDHGGPRVERRR